MLPASVIIGTHNRAERLARLLDGLSRQEVPADEVVVVVDGSTDGTTELLEAERRIPNLRWSWQANAGRAAVRNRGAALAAGPLLIFLDDDMIPDPALVREHRRHHAEFPGSIVTGAVMSPPGGTAFSRFQAHLSERWSAGMVSGGSTALRGGAPFVTAANCSLHRSQFEALHGFDERLTDAEDQDLAERAAGLGIPLYYRHRAHAWHEDGVTFPGLIRRQREYRAAQARLRRLRPGAQGAGSASAERRPRPLARLVLPLFAHPGWIPLVGNDALMGRLPPSVSNRLHDWVLTAHAARPSRAEER